MTTTLTYLVWDVANRAWWRDGEHGYTEDQDEAGRFPAARAAEIAMQAACGGSVALGVTVIVAPEHYWTPSGV